MKISVIIPAYNEEERIGSAIQALLAQNWADFEVIVVDNGSSDRTREVAGVFPHPVRVITESRKGTLWACERGRLEASGEIVVRMDADCLPDPDWLVRGLSHFSNPRVAGVTGPYDYYDAGWFFRYTSLVTQKYIYRFFGFVLQQSGRGAVMIGGNSFMRASALQAAGGFNTELVFYGDDTDTARRISREGHVVFDPCLVMKTSARRFKKEGVIALEAKYIYHFFRQIFASSGPKNSKKKNGK